MDETTAAWDDLACLAALAAARVAIDPLALAAPTRALFWADLAEESSEELGARVRAGSGVEISRTGEGVVQKKRAEQTA